MPEVAVIISHRQVPSFARDGSIPRPLARSFVWDAAWSDGEFTAAVEIDFDCAAGTINVSRKDGAPNFWQLATYSAEGLAVSCDGVSGAGNAQYFTPGTDTVEVEGTWAFSTEEPFEGSCAY